MLSNRSRDFPAAVVISTAVGFTLAAALFLVVVLGPQFRGDYLNVLRFAAVPFVLGFLLTWAILAVARPSLAGKRAQRMSSFAGACGPERASPMARLKSQVGPEQAAAIDRLQESGCWSYGVMSQNGRPQGLLLRGLYVTDDRLEADLREISAVVTLDLTSCPITDQGLARLGDKPYLSQLTLADTAITDAGLVYLSRLPRLKKLDVENTSVTDAGLESVGLLSRSSRGSRR